MSSFSELPSVRALREHCEQIRNQSIANLFAEDHQRFTRFSRQLSGLLFDFSKNCITTETLTHLLTLADETKLSDKIAALFAGEHVNTTENKPALHWALRAKPNRNIPANLAEPMAFIARCKNQLREFVQNIHAHKYVGSTGKPLTTFINIGIGGSDFGPRVAVEALTAFHKPGLCARFIANIEPFEIQNTLAKLDPETSLFIISSKSFSTQETRKNADIARRWLVQHLGDAAFAKHFVAVTANAKAALEFGLAPDNIFAMGDWVGGRYSVWSNIGMPVALMIGYDHFEAFLQGAQTLDEHFETAPLSENLPVLAGLLGIWYRNFFHAESHAIIPYLQALQQLPHCLQQLDMESNGKSVTKDGRETDYATGPIIWGNVGTNSQHAFHQLLHQSKTLIPIDFITAVNNSFALDDLHTWSYAFCLSQSLALMQGQNELEAYEKLIGRGKSIEQAKALAKHLVMPGNRPSNTLVLPTLSPYYFGMLLAFYEHKVYVQGAIWNINSFDQWGVELGKELVTPIFDALEKQILSQSADSSTQGLIAFYHHAKE